MYLYMYLIPPPLGLSTSQEIATFHDPVPVAVTEAIQFQNWNEPLQGHLALTGDPTEMMYVRVCVCMGYVMCTWSSLIPRRSHGLGTRPLLPLL